MGFRILIHIHSLFGGLYHDLFLGGFSYIVHIPFYSCDDSCTLMVIRIIPTLLLGLHQHVAMRCEVQFANKTAKTRF